MQVKSSTIALLKPVKSILISQPAPENGKSPFIDLGNDYNLKVDFRPFIHVESLSSKEFRKLRVYIDEFSSIILTSKTAVDHFFSISEEMRVKISEKTKYFCLNETIALYLQKFIQYRKRRVFVGNGKLDKLIELIKKQEEKNKSKYLLPCSDARDQGTIDMFTKAKINFTEAVMYKTVVSDLSDLRDIKYDILVFFSPTGILSLFDNFPDFVQGETRIAVFGNTTADAARERGLRLDIVAPSPEHPSMVGAVKSYVEQANVGK
ncbi:MAG: uroporphyrinogen-III synthase [Chitinophagales bacterium]|nr:uroporphyrinogen-III synthase [Chitinophagales bacterium]